MVFGVLILCPIHGHPDFLGSFGTPLELGDQTSRSSSVPVKIRFFELSSQPLAHG